MERCILCDKKADKRRQLGSFPVCNRCDVKFDLNRLENTHIPEDEYGASLVEEEHVPYLNALNIFSTLQPKVLAPMFFDGGDVVYGFHKLGNIVGIAIIGKVSKERKYLNPDNEKDMNIICQNINLRIIEILQDLRRHDDGTLLPT